MTERAVAGVLADCPWVGPRPYSEDDEERFFGRVTDVEKLLGLVEHHDFGVLYALSGLGKSSLIQAGLVPSLRQMRRIRQKGIGPTLVLNRWSGLSDLSPGPLLVEAIDEEIERLAGRAKGIDDAQLQEDCERLRVVRPPEPSEFQPSSEPFAPLVEYVAQLCDSAGAIILIIDQGEELMGSGLGTPDPDLEEQALSMVAALHRQEHRCKILFSLREEYLGRLKPLDLSVPGLAARKHRLDPMRAETAQDAIIQAAQLDPRVRVSDEVVTRILNWLSPSSLQATESDIARSVDLLRLQAILVAIFLWARERSGDDAIIINDQALDGFREDLAERIGRSVEKRDLTRLALESHIERVLESTSTEEPPRGPGAPLVRRIVARMAPWLSSPGGFKRHIGGDELIFNAIRDDLDVLGVSSEAEVTREVIAGFLSSQASPISLDLGAGSDADSLSGNGRKFWDRKQTSGILVEAGARALKILCDEWMLKESRGGAVSTFELVHDGFGPALLDWAERERASLRDTLASVVSRCGETFRWVSAEGELLDLTWLGCNLYDVTLRGVRFVDCVLRGTIFRNCVLEACVFQNCDLSGCVFGGGQWREVKVVGCTCPSALLLGVTVDNVQYESSILDGLTLQEITVAGSCTIEDCSLRFAQLKDYSWPGPAGTGFRIESCDLLNSSLAEARLDEVDCWNQESVLREDLERRAPRRGRLAPGPQRARVE